MRAAACSVLTVLIGCSATPGPAATPGSTVTPAAAVTPATTPTHDAEPKAEPDPDAAPLPTLTETQRALVEGINARYREETSATAWSERFEREGREVRDKQAQVLAALAIAPRMRVADIGAGTGLYTMPFADAVGDEGRVYAVDIQPYFLDHLRERARKEGRDNVRAVQATAASAELEADSVDLVFLCDAYHHIEQPIAYLRSLHSALREGGRLVVIDYYRGEPDAWTHGHIRATAAEFRAEIEAAGFEFQTQHEILAENFFFVFTRP